GPRITMVLLPPGRRSISALGVVNGLGANHFLRISGSVQARNTRSGSASKVRSSTRVCSVVFVASAVVMTFSLENDLVSRARSVAKVTNGAKQMFEAIHSLFPRLPLPSQPMSGCFESLRLQLARPALSYSGLRDQPRMLEH